MKWGGLSAPPPMARVPATWKQDERDVAAGFTEALRTAEEYDHVCTRIPLSGSNNRRTDGSDHHGDISFPDAYDLHVELKRRASFAHQSLMDDAIADAKKHGINNTILVTKTKRQRGFTAMLPLDLLFRIIGVPGVRELLKRETSETRRDVDRPRTRVSGEANRRQRKTTPKHQDESLGEGGERNQGRES